MTTYSVGMVGLGTMGRNLMLNIADHKHSIIGYDKDTTKVDQVKAIEDYSNISATDNITQFVQSLERPARIILLVPAGKIVDYVISDLTPLLSQGDIIIDGGNSYFKDTDRRYNDLKTKGIHFMGMGVSGGEKGLDLTKYYAVR
jgi:6-phosphogluconate dehydrogenase